MYGDSAMKERREREGGEQETQMARTDDGGGEGRGTVKNGKGTMREVGEEKGGTGRASVPSRPREEKGGDSEERKARGRLDDSESELRDVGRRIPNRNLGLDLRGMRSLLDVVHRVNEDPRDGGTVSEKCSTSDAILRRGRHGRGVAGR